MVSLNVTVCLNAWCGGVVYVFKSASFFFLSKGKHQKKGNHLLCLYFLNDVGVSAAMMSTGQF